MTNPITHELKCWPTYFSGIIAGTKTFEVRVDDRQYREGDTLHLREFIPADETYTGRECRVDVLSVWRNVLGVYNAYCIMGIRVKSEPKASRIEPRVFRGNGPDCLGCGKTLPEHLTNYNFCPGLPSDDRPAVNRTEKP